MLKAKSASDFPDMIGEFARFDDSGAGSVIYNSPDGGFGVLFSAGFDYEAAVKTITNKKTRASTGYCGGSEDPDTLYCYLRASGGSVQVSTTVEEFQLPELVRFANQFAKKIGTTS